MAYELFIDGFDYYATADITKKWHSVLNGSISATLGRRGVGCLQLSHGYVSDEVFLRSKLITPSKYVVTGMALKQPTTIGAFRIHFKSMGERQFTFQLDMSNGQWIGTRWGTGYAPAATSTAPFPLGNYVYVECGVYLDNSGAFELHVNGSSVGYIPLTNYDTLYSTSTGTIDQIEFSSQGLFGTSYIDDLYIAYGDELKFLGDSRVDTLALTANSTPQDWTPDTGNAWERLNQDAGYIASSTVDAVSLFAAGDISHNPTTIHGIQINGHAYKSDAGSREAALVLKSGATTDVGTPLALSTDPLLIREPYIVDPNTGIAFTKANLNSIEVGAKVTA